MRMIAGAFLSGSNTSELGLNNRQNSDDENNCENDFNNDKRMILRMMLRMRIARSRLFF